MAIDTIVFDFGGVLVDWDPRYLYRKVFADRAQMEWFLGNVCTGAWNAEQDRGRPFAEAIALLTEQYPEQAPLIAMFFDRWEEMLAARSPARPTCYAS